MGKYSTPATFAGQRQGKAPAAQQKKHYKPIDWSSPPWSNVDVQAMIEAHTSTVLHGRGSHLHGACPYGDCDADTDGFMVWVHGSEHGQHYHCRKCNRSGDVITLLRDINGWSFLEAKQKIGVGDETEASHPDSEARKKYQADRNRRDAFFQEQLAALRHLYPQSRIALERLERPRVYLESRGITLAQAKLYGLGYLPFPGEIEQADFRYSDQVKRWQGRILFPLTSRVADEITFAGRTLYGWKRGMSPDAHKAWLEEYNAPYEYNDAHHVARTLKTSPCGHFGYHDAIESSQLLFCEGEFDALSLLLSGLHGVIAMGTNFDAKLIPLMTESVVLAMDTDAPGQKAGRRLAKDLESVGLDTRQVTPSGGKDWNDMFVASGGDALCALFDDKTDTPEPQELSVQPATTLNEQVEVSAEEPFTCLNCGRDGQHETILDFFYDEEGRAFCSEACQDRYMHPAAPEHSFDPDISTWPVPEPDPLGMSPEEKAMSVQFWNEVEQALQSAHASRHEEDAQAVERLAAQFSDGCTITIDPADYTLAEHARHLEQAQTVAPDDSDQLTPSERQARFWQSVEERNRRFDPTKPVNWFNLGFKKDKGGRWYYDRKKGANEEEIA